MEVRSPSVLLVDHPVSHGCSLAEAEETLLLGLGTLCALRRGLAAGLLRGSLLLVVLDEFLLRLHLLAVLVSRHVGTKAPEGAGLLVHLGGGAGLGADKGGARGDCGGEGKGGHRA